MTNSSRIETSGFSLASALTLVAALALLVAGCATKPGVSSVRASTPTPAAAFGPAPVPIGVSISVVASDGHLYLGRTAAAGRFAVTDGFTDCSGTYANDPSRHGFIQAHCSDGRVAMIEVVERDPDFRFGVGSVGFSDGTVADMMFGPSAERDGRALSARRQPNLVTQPQAQPTSLTAALRPASQPRPVSPPASLEQAKPGNEQVASYVKCLNGSVQNLALLSNEPAETVVQAARGLCQTEWAKVTVALQIISEPPMPESMHQRLLLEVIRTRAARDLTPRPTAPRKPQDIDA